MRQFLSRPCRGWWRCGGPALLLMAACGLFAGCNSGSESGRQTVSGQVTFKGNPVPAGTISFEPDAAKKNSGPQGYAKIQNGRYSTSESGKGTPSGPLIVRIEGFDGKTNANQPMGQMIFSYQTAIDLPQGTTSKDFQVPDAAAKNVPKNAGPGP